MNSASISFGGLNEKCGLSRQRQQITIATHKHIGLPALCEIKKWLIVCVSANHATFLCQLNRFAVRKKITKQTEPVFY